MTRFNIIGKEMRVKSVKEHGTGAIIYVPKAWANEKVAVVRGVESETINLAKTIDRSERIVYSYYVLDLVHKGHLKMMRNSKATAGPNGISIVGILTNKAVMERKKKPILSFDDRVALAEAIKYNDFVVAQETYSPLSNIKRIRPNIAMESNSHKEEDIKDLRKYMESIDGKVMVVPYYPNTSSTELKEKIRNG